MLKLLAQSRTANVVALLIFGLGLSIFFPSPSVMAAQTTNLEITNLDLQIWPEYDDPRVLAIYSGTLKNVSNQSYNGLISFNVPKNIEVQMACEIINGSQHSCQLYQVEDKGDFQVLSWRTSKPISPGGEYPFWLEYYYSPLQGSLDKTMDLIYSPFFKTQALNLTIKQPSDSSNFMITPEASSTGKDTEGFTNYYYTFNNVDSTNPVNLSIRYTRSETQPSLKQLRENGGQSSKSEPGSISGWNKTMVIIPVVLFSAALIGFITYSIFSAKKQPPAARDYRVRKNFRNK